MKATISAVSIMKSVMLMYLVGISASCLTAEPRNLLLPGRVVQLKNIPLTDEKLFANNSPNPTSDTLIKSVPKNQSFGLWIEAEGPSQPLNDPRELEKLLFILKNRPIKDVYVQVYRNGKTWFPSRFADESPYKKMLHYGFDPLKKILEVAKAKPDPIRVHVWFNSLRLGSDTNSKVLKYLGKDAVLVSSRGESLLESSGYGKYGCRPDTPGIWLDPNNKRVSALLLNLFLEVYSAYPNIDGLHLDMIRTPFPYSATGEKVDPNCLKFISVEDRLSQIARASLSHDAKIVDPHTKQNEKGPTTVVRKIRRVINALFPTVELSAAVLSNQHKAINHANQNWPQWIEEDLVDRVVTMNYTTDYQRFRREAIDAFKISEDKVSVGLGAWLALRNSPALLSQIGYLKNNGNKRFVLFSYGNLSNPNGEKLVSKISEMQR